MLLFKHQIAKQKAMCMIKEKDTLTEKEVTGRNEKKKPWHMPYLVAICIKTVYIKAVKRSKVRSVLG